MLSLQRGSAAAAGKSGSSRAAGFKLLLRIGGRGSLASESGEGPGAFESVAPSAQGGGGSSGARGGLAVGGQ
eukprot:15355587-Alexandrium_andersonii.AAC.1